VDILEGKPLSSLWAQKAGAHDQDQAKDSRAKSAEKQRIKGGANALY
jgi:hypothetical protein